MSQMIRDFIKMEGFTLEDLEQLIAEYKESKLEEACPPKSNCAKIEPVKQVSQSTQTVKQKEEGGNTCKCSKITQA